MTKVNFTEDMYTWEKNERRNDDGTFGLLVRDPDYVPLTQRTGIGFYAIHTKRIKMTLNKVCGVKFLPKFIGYRESDTHQGMLDILQTTYGGLVRDYIDAELVVKYSKKYNVFYGYAWVPFS